MGASSQSINMTDQFAPHQLSPSVGPSVWKGPTHSAFAYGFLPRNKFDQRLILGGGGFLGTDTHAMAGSENMSAREIQTLDATGQLI